MREEIQQISSKEKSGKKASMGVISSIESRNFTRISDNDTSTEHGKTETARSRATVKGTVTGSGLIKRIFAKLSPKSLLISLVKFYQAAISPWFVPCCRFKPTCSSYAKEALNVHGFFKGSYLSFLRILRCHPFCKGGYDPVPEKKIVKSYKK